MSDAFRRRSARPLIYGHRGVRGPVPENTMIAFERAKSEGADGIELDVRTTKDGRVVVFHDPELTRMTAGADARDVCDVMADELKRIDLQGATAPSLEDVLDWITPTSLVLNVEMKRDVRNRTALVWAVGKALSRRPKLRERLLVSSFDPLMLQPLHVLLPFAPKAFLFHQGQAKHHAWEVARFGPWQAVHPEHVMIEGHVPTQRIVNTWTVNDPSRAQTLSLFGVDGLITDTPGALLAAVS
jgi:glycerophosphoryl diester phosphodiesterase